MKKFAILAVMTVMTAFLMAGCRSSKPETTTAPTTMPATTAATVPETTAATMPSADPTVTMPTGATEDMTLPTVGTRRTGRR